MTTPAADQPEGAGATPTDTVTANPTPRAARSTRQKRGVIVHNVGIPKSAVAATDGRSKAARAKRAVAKRTPARRSSGISTTPTSQFTTALLDSILKANGFQGGGSLTYTEGRKTFVVPTK